MDQPVGTRRDGSHRPSLLVCLRTRALPPADLTAQPQAEPDRPAPGLELLGPYQDSGVRETPYLVRVRGGIVQLTPLLYLTLATVDGTRTRREIAERLTAQLGRRLSEANVAYLLDEKLAPMGLLASSGETSADPATAPPVLALAGRVALVPPQVVSACTRVLLPLFRLPVVLAVLGAVAVLDVRLFGSGGTDAGLRQMVDAPSLALVLFASVALAAGFHELGHATACRYGGASPGSMGVGLHLLWPAFYSDVTDSYRLDRRARLRVDLGGIYFSAVFVLLTHVAYLLTGFEPLTVVIAVQHLEIAYQLLPFLRLDGYYVVADLAGVPDLFARVRPVLAGILPGRRASEEARVLRPRARAIVTLWVLTTVPLLAVAVTLFVIRLPSVLARGRASFSREVDALSTALGRRDVASAALPAVHLAILAIAALGLVLTVLRLLARVRAGRARRAAARSGGEPPPPANNPSPEAVVSPSPPCPAPPPRVRFRPERGSALIWVVPAGEAPPSPSTIRAGDR